MQKQLKHLALLPAAIQATLAAVSDKIETILPEPRAELVDETTDSEADDTEAGVLSEESGEILEEELTTSGDLLSDDEASSYQEVMASKSESEASTASSSPEPELSEGQKVKLLKQQKVESLNRSWPWANDSKPVYKIADHYQSTYSNCINNQVKWLEKTLSTDQLRAKKVKGI